MRLIINNKYSEIKNQKASLKDRMELKLYNYFRLKGYDKEVIQQIVCKEFINNNPYYYLYYPYLFKQYFDVTDNQSLDLLSIAGYLYYRSVIIIDEIFDNDKSSNKFGKYIVANTCQEEAVKILSEFFDVDSDFWNTWNYRKIEYAQAYKLDKSLQKIHSYEEYETLADCKSAFGKIAIDCLFHISGKKSKEQYDKLLDSHKFFYVGFQIIDDISDFIEDIENNQFNISNFELCKQLEKSNETFEDYRIHDLKKLIHLNGISETLYRKAVVYFERAFDIEKEINLNNISTVWKDEIIAIQNTAVGHFLNIHGFVNRFKTTRNLTYEKLDNFDIKVSIEKAVKYILDKKEEKGEWHDIFNEGGISDTWTTAFVLNNIKGINRLKKFDFFESIDFLKNNKSTNNLWGYNKSWIPDADSSSFAILATMDFGSFKGWLSYQNRDGGFSTYNSEEEIYSSLNSPQVCNVDGWMQSHFCVSAVAYSVFIRFQQSFSAEFEKLRTYLLLKLSSEIELLSYWWINDSYALAYLMEATSKNNDLEIQKLCRNRIDKIVDEDRNQGLFYRSMLLRAIVNDDVLKIKYKDKIEFIVEKILEEQCIDGSWEGEHFLKIPSPNVTNPMDKKIIWTKTDRGTNILVKDYHRIFTTVSCLKALSQYGEIR
jgi:hypothetical protein